MEREEKLVAGTTEQLYTRLGMDPERISRLFVTRENGEQDPWDIQKIRSTLDWASRGYESIISIDLLLKETLRNVFEGISAAEIDDALLLASISFIEIDPAYGYAAARLLNKKLFKEVTGVSLRRANVEQLYKEMFVKNMEQGIQEGIFDQRMREFDLEVLAQGLCPERDNLLDYMGMRTLYERYFTKDEQQVRLELPQMFWMRVAIGLTLNEHNKTARVLEFYNTMSQLDYVPSTPTLLHSALTRPQLSSCFLGTVEDDLKHIFKCVGDNAQLSKWSGGVAYDWSNIRAIGSMIKSIKVESQGVIPFLRIANDTTAAINRSGKRRSASVVYLETWHLEVEDFLDLRRNTGDERRRTHDINTANWIPDLFMKRVIADENWTLFSPHEASDLHHLYGKAFEERYEQYEQMAREGKLEQHKVIQATKLWRKMLSRLFETGHPWFTFKDPSNIRSPQDHVGVVHSSNLCTEITLNTSADETAVCNLGSVNLGKHMVEGRLDDEKLARTVKTAMRMLDNVIDINYYPVIEAKNANLRHRPVGLGMMGFQDALYKANITFESPDAFDFANQAMEKISYHAILSSSELAKERGTYTSYSDSKWDRGIFPQDTIRLLEQERDVPIEGVYGGVLDWMPVREHVKQYGMRNSNCMAIAPTATISNIAGCFPCIEPIYKNLYVKANMSGEFTVINKYLVEDLKKLDLWSTEMRDKIKYYDGSVQMIDEIPRQIKEKYKEAFEVDPFKLVELTAARGQWIDQSQSHNVFMKGVSGKKLSDLYIYGWKLGLKTFYYLRTLGASQIEKSTLDAKKYGFTQKRNYQTLDNKPKTAVAQSVSPAEDVVDIESAEETLMSKACSLSDDPECDVCQ